MKLFTEILKYRHRTVLSIFAYMLFFNWFLSGFAQTNKALVEQVNKQGEAYILIKLPKDKKTQYRLNKIVSIDRSSISKDYAYAYVSKNRLDDFQKLGLEYRLQTHPSLKLAASMCADLSGVKNWNCYPTYQQYLDLMSEFATNYPNLCLLDTIGTSTDGRLVLSVKISDNVGQNEEEPAFFYSSTMHGDEVTGYVLMLRFIDYLLSNYQTDAEIKKLIDNTEIWINPLANPDGTYASGNTDITGATRYNANGYDLNRNFPDPSDGEYPGGTRQKETQDMMNFMAAKHFVLAANFHGGAEVVNYPWDTWSTRHADDNWYINISRAYADTAHIYNSAYMTDLNNGITNGYDWYSINGGRQDYHNYYLHSRETTIELSSAKMPDAASLPDYWNYNYRSLLNYINQVHYGIYGKITDTEGNPVKAKLYIENHDKDSSEVYSNPENGMYYRMIAAGTYTLNFSAPGYSPVVKSNISIAENEQLRLDITMEKNSTAVYEINKDRLQIKTINNPFTNQLNINLYLEKSAGNISVALYNLSGQKQTEVRFDNLPKGDNYLTLNTSGLSQGYYLLKIGTENSELSTKLVKN